MSSQIKCIGKNCPFKGMCINEYVPVRDNSGKLINEPDWKVRAMFKMEGEHFECRGFNNSLQFTIIRDSN